MLNRCVVTVLAKEPFLTWLQSLPESGDLTIDQVNQDATTYLLPDYEDDDEQQLVLAQYYDLIFEDQLAGWWTEERDWPENRDLAMFTRWFSVEFHSVVIDLADDVLRDEEQHAGAAKRTRPGITTRRLTNALTIQSPRLQSDLPMADGISLSGSSRAPRPNRQFLYR